MIQCHIVTRGNSDHLSRLFAGFTLLQKAGVVRLSQECIARKNLDPARPQHLRDARLAHLLVVVNGSLRIYYDNHDSHEIDEDAAAGVDAYFKRSYSCPRIPNSFKDKVFPFGLNYALYPTTLETFEAERIRAFAPKPSRRTAPDGRGMPSFRPTPENMQSAPVEVLPPRVLFMTRAWDPFDISDRPDEKSRERIRINEMRASCLEALKREFGDTFFGGFERTDYAARNYGGLLLQDGAVSSKANYVKLLGSYPICVSTTGLHGSIGWKMGEYVAFSKAIVSERLTHELPGDFREGRNYLEFATVEGCVDAVRKLFSDASLRHAMMVTNFHYYLKYVKADVAIRRTLDIALSKRTAGGLTTGTTPPRRG